MKSIQHGYVTYHADGSVNVLIDKEGLPEMTSALPAPFMDAIARDRSVAKAIDGKYLSGYFLIEQKQIRNIAFDKDGEKTTTEFRYRACKNEDEAKLVGEKIKAILEKMKEDDK